MRRSQKIAATVGLVALAALRWVTTPPWPDDWDGVGFVEAVTRFDLDHFVPHAPGYPVYVAMLRCAAFFTSSPRRAANAVAVVTGVAALALLTSAAERRLGWRRAAWIGASAAVAPLAWRCSTAIGSEAPALAFACAAVAGAGRSERAAPWWIGVAVGLGLGVRISWAPLFLACLVMAPGGRRVATGAIAAIASAAWAVPFVAVVGASHLAALAKTQATGHFEAWGGTVASEPGARRAIWFARDLFVDGLGIDADPLGVAIAVLAAALALEGAKRWRALGYPHARGALLLVPYATWILLGQNLHQQPRHALPLVVGLALALAMAATTSRRAHVVGAVLFALVALRSGIDARARLATPPPGEQLVTLARSLDGRPAIYGGPSARFLEIQPTSGPKIEGGTAATLGDVRLAVSRLSSLPSRVLVTSELLGLSTSSYPLIPLATLCRPARVDRRAPCIDVFDWRAPFLASAGGH